MKSKSLLVVSIVLNICLLLWGGYAELQSRFYTLKLNNYIDFNLQRTDDTRAIMSWGNTLQKLGIDSVDICFFGNSITRNSDFTVFFPEKRIVNLGYGGDDVENCIRRIDHIKAISPDKIFVMMGINKLKYFSLQRFEKNMLQW